MATRKSSFNIFKANGFFIGLEIFLCILAYVVFGLGSFLPGEILNAVKYDSSNRNWNLAYPNEIFGSIQHNVWYFCILFSNILIFGCSTFEISGTINKKFGAMISACVMRCIHFLVFIALAILYFTGNDFVYNADGGSQCLFNNWPKEGNCNKRAAEMVTFGWWFSFICMDFLRLIFQVMIIHKFKGTRNVSFDCNYI